MKTETEKFEVKFRGLRLDKSEVVFGNFFHWKRYGKNIPIIGEGVQNGSIYGFEVIPETVGRFINKKDIHNNDLYQGDIVRWGMMENGLETLIRYAVIEINPDIQFRIIFYINPETNERVETDGKVFNYSSFMYQRTELYLEKLGNIHQNPELLNIKKP